jgi:uridylate kinase
MIFDVLTVVVGGGRWARREDQEEEGTEGENKGHI